MVTRATRSPRRRTVVALAVVLAVLAGFIVRLVDIQVVNAERAHRGFARPLRSAAPSPCTERAASIVDETGQTLAGSVLEYDCQLDPLLITQIDQDIRARQVQGEAVVRRSRSRSPRSPARTSKRCRRSSATRSPRTRSPATRSSTSSCRPRSTASSPTSASPTSPACSIQRAPTRTALSRGNLVGFMGTDGDTARGARAEPEFVPRRQERHARVRARQGRGDHPRHQAREARRRRRHAAAHHQPRPAVVHAAADRRAGAEHGRQARLDHGRRDRDRQDPRGRGMAERGPQRRERLEGRRPRQPDLPRNVRARLDLQGHHRRDPDRRRRTEADLDSGRCRATSGSPTVRACGTRSSTRPTSTRSRVCSSTPRTPASRSSANG